MHDSCLRSLRNQESRIDSSGNHEIHDKVPVRSVVLRVTRTSLGQTFAAMSRAIEVTLYSFEADLTPAGLAIPEDFDHVAWSTASLSAHKA